MPYYTLSFVTALLAEVAMLPLLALLIFREWAWFIVAVAVVLGINFLVSVFLNARTRVEFKDPADARQDKPGRWYPKDGLRDEAGRWFPE